MNSVISSYGTNVTLENFIIKRWQKNAHAALFNFPGLARPLHIDETARGSGTSERRRTCDTTSYGPGIQSQGEHYVASFVQGESCQVYRVWQNTNSSSLFFVIFNTFTFLKLSLGRMLKKVWAQVPRWAGWWRVQSTYGIISVCGDVG